MRLALQGRLLASRSIISILYSTVHSDFPGFGQHYFRPPTIRGQSRNYTAQEYEVLQLLASEARALRIGKVSAAVKDDGHGNGNGPERNWPDTPQAHAGLPDAQGFEQVEGAGLSQSALSPSYRMVPTTQRDVHGGNLDSGIQLDPPSKTKRWRGRLVTFEQYQYQSDSETRFLQGQRLVEKSSYAQDWELWMELIVFRRRHHGAKGTMAVYKEIFRRDLRMPTQGILANQFWDILIQAGSHDSGLLEEILIYAMRLKLSTRRSWSELYYGIMSNALKNDPDSAYNWHAKLKYDFPPSLEHYQKIFRLSFDLGCSVHFRGLYEDTPVIGMYKTVILHLCELQMYTQALRWHELLCKAGDFPTEFSDIQTLLDHLVYIGDRYRFEKIIRQLAEAKVRISNVAEDYAQRDTAITREIMNRRLGEVHGIAPKSLSDSFCARLFATQFFSVETIIKGLHMIAAEVIGPLSLREIAFRDKCDPAAIAYHIDVLRDAGISLDNSVFCTIVRNLAMENKCEILKSVVECDLHPDTFVDHGLQERLLAEYYEENDPVKIERTLAILTASCSVKNLQIRRVNLILRSQITLGRREKVLALIEEMKQTGIPLSARSSRHLRVCWLSRRQIGRGPQSTQELTILIKASQMTIQAGGFVSIIAWREILRRLGMAGRLLEVENLALWLVDWYSSPAAEAAVSKRALSSAHRGRALVEGHVWSEESPNFDPKRYLNTLFTTSARHAIVAWGFQYLTTSHSSVRRFNKASRKMDLPQFERTTGIQWTWGLHLLRKLREHGLPVHQYEVARICRHRLITTFGAGLSKRKINRQARAQNSFSQRSYVRKMEEIWGKDLFRVYIDGRLKGRMRPKRRKSLRQWRKAPRPRRPEYRINSDTYDEDV